MRVIGAERVSFMRLCAVRKNTLWCSQMRLRTHRYQTGHGLVVGAPGLSRPADEGDASSGGGGGGGTEGIREEMGKSF